jgi:hypothetical protein
MEEQAALGVRYGLAGEALFALRAPRNVPAMLVDDNRLVRSGLGLFALEWLRRVDRVENPFREDEAKAREFEQQRGYEAARFLAALELHAEGLSLDEAVQAFRRRTSVDADTAFAEVMAAQRDPLHGVGYLGLLELRALEARLAEVVGAKKALRLCLLLVGRHPELRPLDFVTDVPRPAAGAAGKGQGKRRAALENPGQTQHELSRSR